MARLGVLIQRLIVRITTRRASDAVVIVARFTGVGSRIELGAVSPGLRLRLALGWVEVVQLWSASGI